MVKEILQLRANGLSFDQIAQRCDIGATSVRKYFHAAEKIGLDWNQAKYHSRQRLSNELQAKQSSPKDYVIPQFQELAKLIFLRKINTIDEAYGVYLMQEQRARHYSKATFHRKYNQWLKNNQQKWEDSYLSHNWVSGQCCQIDYSGDQLTLQVEGVNGVFETRKVDIFVGVLPYSKYLFCYASKDQTRESWLNAIIEMFKFFDGVPKVTMFDNFSTLVTRASRHNPILCQKNLDLERHYGVPVEAVAPGEPSYKGSVENAVKQIQNKILTPLKSMRFFSINEINSILRRGLIRLNNFQMRILRKELFELEYRLYSLYLSWSFSIKNH